MLEDVGSWNASWSEVCDSIHDLAEDEMCLQHVSSSARAGCYNASRGKHNLLCMHSIAILLEGSTERQLTEELDQILSSFLDSASKTGS